MLVQALVNLLAVFGMAPLTGVPLPFVSYGNASMLVMLAAVGLLLNIARGGSAGSAARPSSGGARLRVVDGQGSSGRSARAAPASRSSGKVAKGRNSRGRNGGARRSGAGRRRRATS